MPQALRAKFGISLSNRAVLFDWATTDDLIAAARTAARRLVEGAGHDLPVQRPDEVSAALLELL